MVIVVVVVFGAVSLGLLRRGCHAVPMDAERFNDGKKNLRTDVLFFFFYVFLLSHSAFRFSFWLKVKCIKAKRK